jgi:hypothetical protein
MSTSYTETAACAQRIYDLLNIPTSAARQLKLSGRLPELPAVTLRDLLPAISWGQLGEGQRERLSSTIQSRLRMLRERLVRQYQQMTEQIHSLEHIGVPDLDTEDRLTLMYESSYHRFLDELRQRLIKALSSKPGGVDNRSNNTRGGFGDVSPPPPPHSS